jgi:hypothetical protein
MVNSLSSECINILENRRDKRYMEIFRKYTPGFTFEVKLCLTL